MAKSESNRAAQRKWHEREQERLDRIHHDVNGYDTKLKRWSRHRAIVEEIVAAAKPRALLMGIILKIDVEHTDMPIIEIYHESAAHPWTVTTLSLKELNVEIDAMFNVCRTAKPLRQPQSV